MFSIRDYKVDRSIDGFSSLDRAFKKNFLFFFCLYDILFPYNNLRDGSRFKEIL